MKRTLKRVLSIVLIISSLVTLGACGQNNKKENTGKAAPKKSKTTKAKEERA